MSVGVLLLLVHGLVSIALLGAITHQGLSVWRRPAPVRFFFDRYRAVAGERYASAVVLLYAVAFGLGAYLYPSYVIDVKAALADDALYGSIFIFQMKEHIAVLGLGLLPVYWHLWRRVALREEILTRQLLTSTLMACVWWNLLIGHILNNTRGMA